MLHGATPETRKGKAKKPVDDKTPADDKPNAANDPAPEEDCGSGDICSPEPSPAAEDDAPLP